MNERKFNRELRFDILNNILTSSSIDELIKKEKKAIFDNEDIYVLIQKNLRFIIDNTLSGYKAEMINYLYKIDLLKNDIEDILLELLEDLDYYEYSEFFKGELGNNIIQIVNTSFKSLLEKKKLKCLLYIKDKNRISFTKENIDLLNEYIENHKLEYSKILVEESNMYIPNYNSKDYVDLIKMVSYLIEELKDHSNINYSDIKYLGYGAYSRVYQIGDKVLKLGSERGSYQIGNDKRLLQPLLRLNLSDSFNISGTIEITNVVDTDVHLSEEELYQLYKELRQRGIIYTDLRVNNLGYLKSNNEYNWHEELGDDPKVRGLDKKVSDSPLKKGEIVILDSDYIYNEDQARKIDYGNSYIKVFEDRYQKELKNLKKEYNQHTFIDYSSEENELKSKSR